MISTWRAGRVSEDFVRVNESAVLCTGINWLRVSTGTLQPFPEGLFLPRSGVGRPLQEAMPAYQPRLNNYTRKQ